MRWNPVDSYETPKVFVAIIILAYGAQQHYREDRENR